MPRRIIPSPVPPGCKWCFRCSSALPIQRFEVDRSTNDGRRYACRPCIAAKQRQRRAIKLILAETYARLNS
jgi:hypothetical protein